MRLHNNTLVFTVGREKFHNTSQHGLRNRLYSRHLKNKVHQKDKEWVPKSYLYPHEKQYWDQGSLKDMLYVYLRGEGPRSSSAINFYTTNMRKWLYQWANEKNIGASRSQSEYTVSWKSCLGMPVAQS